MAEEKRFSKKILGKTVVSKAGKRFGDNRSGNGQDGLWHHRQRQTPGVGNIVAGHSSASGEEPRP